MFSLLRKEMGRKKIRMKKQKNNMLKFNCPCLKSKLPCPHILTQLLQKFTLRELADIYGVNEKTIRRNLRPSDKPKLKRGRKRKVKGNKLNLLRDYAIAKQIITQKTLA